MFNRIRSKKKKINKKEEDFKFFFEKIKKIKNELDFIQEEYPKYLTDKTTFNIHLNEDSKSEISYKPQIVNKHSTATKVGATLIGGKVGLAATSGVKTIYHPDIKTETFRLGFDGTMTFYDEYFELLPENEGITTRIPYNEIRKISYKKHLAPKITGTIHFQTNLVGLESIYLWIYLHDGDIYRISIYNEVPSQKALLKMNEKNKNKNYDYVEWCKTNYQDVIFELHQYSSVGDWGRFRDRDRYTKELKVLYPYFIDIGYQMNSILFNRIKYLFNEHEMDIVID